MRTEIRQERPQDPLLERSGSGVNGRAGGDGVRRARHLSTRAIVSRSARHPWRVVVIWLLAVVAGVMLNAKLLPSALTTEVRFTNNPQAKQAATILDKRLLGPTHVSEVVIVQSSTHAVHDPLFRAFVESLRTRIAHLGSGVVLSVTDTYVSAESSLTSPDGHTTLIPLTMAGTVDQAAQNIAKVHRVTIDGHTPAGFRVLQSGQSTVGEDFKTIAEKDLKTGEMLGILVALIILLLVFGSPVAAVVPIILGVVDISVALGIVAVLGRFFHFSFTVTNMITMIGLAVGIDYSLFVVSRFREERARGLDKVEALVATGGTASRAVLFSGMTVVLALFGMLLIPVTIFRSLGSGAIIVVCVAIVASLTLLPAVLSLLGDRVNSFRLPFLARRSADDHESGFWAWATRTVTARPLVSLLVTTGLLLSAGIWLFGMRTGFDGISTLPRGVQSEQAFAVMAKDFSGGLTQPIQVVITGPVNSGEVRGAIGRFTRLVAHDPTFGPPAAEVNGAGNLALVSVPLRGDPNSPLSYDAVRWLRSTAIPTAFASSPVHVVVGGDTASAVDFFALTHHYTPIVFAFVLGLSFLLLMVVFRSIVLPILSILLNLLSVGAAYGLVVLVNQKGIGGAMFGFQKANIIEAWFPLFLFCVLFGLSMDYHVFLLSRIRERYGSTRDNTEAVAFGLRSTGKIITGAAIIMVAVFGGFAAGNLVMMQEMGFGLAIAVLIDATIVRSVMVPSAMELLGDWNWYLPRWLQWLPVVRFEGKQVPASGEGPATREVRRGRASKEVRIVAAR
jgi:putative drug exporter of the RND superfamily